MSGQYEGIGARLLEQMEAWGRTRDPEALADLGRLYQAIEEHRAALACFAALVEIDGENETWRYHFGAEAQVHAIRRPQVRGLVEQLEKGARQAIEEFGDIWFFHGGTLSSRAGRANGATLVLPWR